MISIGQVLAAFQKNWLSPSEDHEDDEDRVARAAGEAIAPALVDSFFPEASPETAERLRAAFAGTMAAGIIAGIEMNIDSKLPELPFARRIIARLYREG